MKKATIGAILRKRIKEMGYTQENFADYAGIGYSTLKKYLNGETAYTYEMLDTFSKLLDCSYEYLLGKSKSTIGEYKDISNHLLLSNESIEKISSYAKEYDLSPLSKLYIDTLNKLIEEDNFIETLRNYFISSKYQQKQLEEILNIMGEDTAFDFPITNDTMQIIDIVIRIKDIKNRVNQDNIDYLKSMHPENVIAELEVLLKTEGIEG